MPLVNKKVQMVLQLKILYADLFTSGILYNSHSPEVEQEIIIGLFFFLFCTLYPIEQCGAKYLCVYMIKRTHRKKEIEHNSIVPHCYILNVLSVHFCFSFSHTCFLNLWVSAAGAG